LNFAPISILLLSPLKEWAIAYWDGVWWRLLIIGFVIVLGTLYTYGFFEKESR